MKKNNWIFRAVCMTLASLILTATVSVAADVGSSGDPLVTLSYLNDTYFNAILSKVDSRIAAQGGGSGTSGTASTFTLVTLSSGQTLKGGIGCEVMLRVGTATCSASSTPGLIDTTDATTLNNGGGLGEKHVYIMTIEERGGEGTAGPGQIKVPGGKTLKKNNI